MSELELLHGDITRRIIGAFYRVSDELGYGFLENVYCGALESEFRVDGLEYHTRVELGMQLHFGPNPAFRRMLFENKRKRGLEIVE